MWRKHNYCVTEKENANGSFNRIIDSDFRKLVVYRGSIIIIIIISSSSSKVASLFEPWQNGDVFSPS